MNRIYFDNNATTPIEHAVHHSMLSYFGDPESFGNPSSIHGLGRKAKVALDEARESLGAALGLRDENELVFTGSGTEATNAALKGFYFHRKNEGKETVFLSSGVEHEATLETLNFLRDEGAQVELLPVDKSGTYSLDTLRAALERWASPNRAILISVMAANNETGICFPVREIAALGRTFGASIHVDAIQALGRMAEPFILSDLDIDLASLSAHKIGGPKGIGALYVRRGVKLVSLLSGGAQERKRRAGTHNVAGIIGFGAAARELGRWQAAPLRALQRKLEKGLLEQISGLELVGEGATRLVNTSNLLFQSIRGDSLLMNLDLEGIAVSTGSACSSGTVNPSHVLLAMGYSPDEALSGLRISLGPQNTEAEVDRLLEVLPGIVERVRRVQAGKAACERPSI